MCRKLTLEEAQQEFINRNYIPLFDIYENVDKKLFAETTEGYIIFTNISNLRIATPRIFYKTNPYTIQNIKLWCKINNKPFELLSKEYNGDRENLEWQCLKPECGEIFKANWNHIFNNRGCGYCHGSQVGTSNCLATKNPELSKEWHFILNGDLTPYNVTQWSDKEVWWQCPNNSKHEWKSTIANRNNGNNCPYCQGKLPSEDYNLLFCNDQLCEEWNYNKNEKKPEEYTPGSAKKVWWLCKKCGHEWESTINSRNKGIGCPKCNESKGEKQLDIILTQYNIPHDSQYKFNNLRGIGNGLLKFDVPIFWDIEKTRLRMLIEYDGIFHYEKKFDRDGFETLKIHDEMKNQYCKNNNIKLVRIPYWEFDNIEQILKKELII